jgi:hypothetical protein
MSLLRPKTVSGAKGDQGRNGDYLIKPKTDLSRRSAHYSAISGVLRRYDADPMPWCIAVRVHAIIGAPVAMIRAGQEGADRLCEHKSAAV